MRDFVKAGRDVGVQHPLIGVGPQHVDLGDRVVGSTFRAEPVGARVEVRLEDRFQDQLERGLHHPVRGGRNSQAAELPAALGDHPLPDRQRRELTGLHLLVQAGKECPLD